MAIRTVDPVTRQPLGTGEVGELAVRGYVTPGSFRGPELDVEAFDANGYCLTGDLGSIEPDGRVRFRGRLAEMIKTGGANVAPLEVEEVLLQHPDVVQADVVGMQDRSKGEIVAAAIELRSAAPCDTASILAFCRERLATYKVPMRLAIRAAADFPWQYPQAQAAPGAGSRRRCAFELKSLADAALGAIALRRTAPLPQRRSP